MSKTRTLKKITKLRNSSVLIRCELNKSSVLLLNATGKDLLGKINKFIVEDFGSKVEGLSKGEEVVIGRDLLENFGYCILGESYSANMEEYAMAIVDENFIVGVMEREEIADITVVPAGKIILN